MMTDMEGADVRSRPESFYRRSGKRIFDVAVASLALAMLSPILAFVAIAIRLRMGRPVLFRQIRPGRGGAPFEIIKFRTMVDTRDDRGALLPDGARLSGIGSFLRKMSLDELPELVNVLRGEMSLVGPRPLLTKYLPYYTPVERRRFSVRPGITGWAQVRGRNDARWDQRLADDVWYVDNCSLLLDLRIIAMTLRKALVGANVQLDPRSTMLDLDQQRSGGTRRPQRADMS